MKIELLETLSASQLYVGGTLCIAVIVLALLQRFMHIRRSVATDRPNESVASETSGERSDHDQTFASVRESVSHERQRSASPGVGSLISTPSRTTFDKQSVKNAERRHMMTKAVEGTRQQIAELRKDLIARDAAVEKALEGQRRTQVLLTDAVGKAHAAREREAAAYKRLKVSEGIINELQAQLRMHDESLQHEKKQFEGEVGKTYLRASKETEAAVAAAHRENAKLLAAADERVKDLSLQVESLEQRRKDAEARASSAVSAVVSLENTRATLGARAAELESTVEALRRQLEDAHSITMLKDAEVSLALSEQEKTVQQMRLQDARVKDTETRYLVLDTKYQDALREVEEQRRRADAHERQFQTLTRTCAMMVDEIDTLRAKVTATQQQAASQVTGLVRKYSTVMQLKNTSRPSSRSSTPAAKLELGHL